MASGLAQFAGKEGGFLPHPSPCPLPSPDQRSGEEALFKGGGGRGEVQLRRGRRCAEGGCGEG